MQSEFEPQSPRHQQAKLTRK
uniref:Uncharacterized protein n=1 Tax=Timema poppense TaxID=170557 RepID=A0A7R9H714_TIMPO|nr:unnamed protein product [Timema poppensis]